MAKITNVKEIVTENSATLVATTDVLAVTELIFDTDTFISRPFIKSISHRFEISGLDPDTFYEYIIIARFDDFTVEFSGSLTTLGVGEGEVEDEVEPPTEIIINQYPTVKTFGLLPNPKIQEPDTIFLVLSTTGSPPNRQSAGFYKSDGLTWEYLGIPESVTVVTSGQISDFQDTVSVNPNVLINIDKVSADGSIEIHDDVDFPTAPVEGDTLKFLSGNWTNDMSTSILVILVFTVSPVIIDYGTQGVIPSFSWDYDNVDNPVDSASIDQGVTISSATLEDDANSPQVSPVSFNGTTATGDADGEDIVFILNATKAGLDPGNKVATMSFQHKIYWGVSANANVHLIAGSGAGGSFTTGDILGEGIAGADFETARAGFIRNFNASGGRYLYFLFPVAFGVTGPTSPDLQVGAFPITLAGDNKNVINLENDGGHVESYNIYRTDIQFGENITVELL